MLVRRFAVGLGTGGHPELEQAMRGHGNFTEYIPIGILPIVSRRTHAWGRAQSRGPSVDRLAGVALTVMAPPSGTGVNLALGR